MHFTGTKSSPYLKSHFCRKKNVVILSSCTQRCYVYTSYRFLKIGKPLLVVYRFYCMALFHSQMRRHVINIQLLTCVEVDMECCYMTGDNLVS